MQNKAPQGKQDPIPTPESELEQYGVWVKAEPQDVVDEPVTGKPISRNMAHDADAKDLLSEQEDLVDSFEFDKNLTDGIEELEALSPSDDLEIIGELPEEIEAFDLEAMEQVDLESLPEPLGEDISADVTDDAALDISLDDLDYEEPPAETEPISFDTEKPSDTSFNTTDIDIEDFGISDTDTADSLPSIDDFNMDEPSGKHPEATLAPEDSLSDDFESLDIDLQFDDTIPLDDSVESSESFTASDDVGIDVTSDFESVDIDSIGLQPPSRDAASSSFAPDAPDVVSGTSEPSNISMDSFIDLDDSDVPGIVPDMELENVSLNDEPIGFDDVQAVTDDLGAKQAEPSSDLLQKIVLELSSIKDELVSLRGQLSSLKAANQAAPEPEEGLIIADEGAPGGFFDEEDDDTIALTGDELDNILNTADFTEEIADDEPFDGTAMPSLEIPDDIELLPEDGVYEPQESGIETIELPTIEPTAEEFESISAQDGVTPITNLPEDTSFLDGAEDEMSLDLEMPLEDVPLVEPDSSDLDSIIDSAFDSEDTQSADHENQNEEAESEIVLDFDSDDEPVISTVDSFPAPLDELEDALDLEEFVESDDLGGLELLGEESELEELEELSLDDDIPATEIEDFGILDASSEDPESVASLDQAASSGSLSTPESDLFVETPASNDNVDEVEEIEEVASILEPEPMSSDAESFETATEVEAVDASPKPDTAAVAEALPSDSDKLAPDKLKHDVKSVLLYLDQLLASLPEEKIEEFASSEYYDTYKRLFDDLGLL